MALVDAGDVAGLLSGSAPGGAETIGMEDASTLAAEVFQVAGILSQGQDGAEGQYTFPLDNMGACEDTGTFELARDDMHHLIGLLNSPEVDRSKAQLGALLQNLPREAVEGLTRRLFAALKSRSEEQARLKQSAEPVSRLRSGPTRGRQTQSQPKLGASPRGVTSQQRGSYFGTYRTGEGAADGAAVQVQVAEEVVVSPTGPVGTGPKRGSYFGLYSDGATCSLRSNVQPVVRQVSQDRPFRARTRSPDAEPSAKAQQRAANGPMPHVFQRLFHGDTLGHSSPRTNQMVDESRALGTQRAQIVADASANGGPEVSRGPAGIQEDEQGPLVSDYLNQLLQRREIETGMPATATRRGQGFDFDPQQSFSRPAVRVPEEKAKEIYDRLYKSGQELRCRRSVYSRLGEMVQEAKNAQTCTFEPKVPLAQHRGGAAPQGSVFDRLHQDMTERTKRKDELLRKTPGPSFRPRTNESARREMEQGIPGVAPQPAPPMENGGEDGGDDGAEVVQSPGPEEPQLAVASGGGAGYSPHDRLYNDHRIRQQRKEAQTGNLVKWKDDFNKKHPFKPNLIASKVSFTPSQLVGDDRRISSQEREFGVGQEPEEDVQADSVPSPSPPLGVSVEVPEGSESIAASAAAAFANASGVLPAESPGGVMQTLVENTAQQLPEGPRVVVMGGNRFRSEDTETLVRAVAERFASKLGGRATVLTGGQPGAQEVFARSLGDEFPDLVNLLPEYISDPPLEPYGIGRDIICGETTQDRMQVLTQVGDVYLTFEGGPNVATTMRAVVERGAVVVPLMSTGGASAGLFEAFPRDFMTRPDFATEAQWAALGDDEGLPTPRAAVPPEVAATACVDIVAGYLDRLPGVSCLDEVPGPVESIQLGVGDPVQLLDDTAQEAVEGNVSPGSEPPVASPRLAATVLTPRTALATASPRTMTYVQAIAMPAGALPGAAGDPMQARGPPPQDAVAPPQSASQPTGVDSLGGGSQVAGTPVGGAVTSIEGAAPLSTNNFTDGNAPLPCPAVEKYGTYGAPTGAVAMPARQPPLDPFRVPARLASAGAAVGGRGGSLGGSSLGGSSQAGGLDLAAAPLLARQPLARQAQSAASLPASAGGVAPVVSARMSSAPQPRGYAGGMAGSSAGAGVRTMPPPGAGPAAPWGMACAGARGNMMAMR